MMATTFSRTSAFPQIAIAAGLLTWGAVILRPALAQGIAPPPMESAAPTTTASASDAAKIDGDKSDRRTEGAAVRAVAGPGGATPQTETPANDYPMPKETEWVDTTPQSTSNAASPPAADAATPGATPAGPTVAGTSATPDAAGNTGAATPPLPPAGGNPNPTVVAITPPPATSAPEPPGPNAALPTPPSGFSSGTPAAPPTTDALDALAPQPGPPPATGPLDAMLPKPTVPQVADPLAPPPGTLPPTGPNVADLPSTSPPLRVANPTLRDTATIVADGRELVLYGIEGRSGEDAAVLQNYIASAGGTLECRPEEADRHVCTLPDGTDLAKVALVNGIASYALGGPQAYRDEEEEAQKARRGLWAELPPLPPEIDHPTLPDTGTVRALTGESLRLDGVEGVSGPMATTLQGYIAANGDTIQCQPEGPDRNVCLLRDGTDIAKVALVNGLAKATADANPDYLVEQDAAKANRRGIWAKLSPDEASQAGADMARRRAIVASVDTSGDGYTVVDGQPTMLVEGVPVFMVFAGAAGWGYWDHGRHWHGAPGPLVSRLEAAHPRGEGLRGWSNPGIRQAMATARPGEFGRGAPVFGGHGALVGGRVIAPGIGAGLPGGLRGPISGAGFLRPGGLPGGGVHPGFGAPTMGAARPGFGAPAIGGARPGFGAPAIGGARPGFGAPAVAGIRPGFAPPAFGGGRPGFSPPAFGGGRPGFAAPVFGGARPGAVPMAPAMGQRPAFAPHPVAAPRPVLPPHR